MHRDKEIVELLKESIRLQREILRHLKRLQPQPSTYSLRVRMENSMSIGNIVAGTTGQLEVEVFENGVLYTPPVGTTYAPTISWTASDPSVSFTLATADDSGGSVPLDQQVVVEVPGGITSTSVTITATTTDPNGNTITGTISIPLTSAPQVFTLQVSQVA